MKIMFLINYEHLDLIGGLFFTTKEKLLTNCHVSGTKKTDGFNAFVVKILVLFVLISLRSCCFILSNTHSETAL